MVDGTYDLVVSTPLGDKQATAKLKAIGDSLSMDVKVPGLPRLKGTGRVSGDSFSAEGAVKIPFVGSYDYSITGAVAGDRIEAVCRMASDDLLISGVRK